NLASVILQMANIGLGDMGRFPFVEPPDRRTIRDGERLLDELGAIRRRRADGDPVRLTKTGRRLARLPIDPRLARMLLEADRLDCVREVLVIVSALSIQDVRERPVERRETADQLHARFKVDGSDLLSIVALWDHLRVKQRELSGNAFRRMCRDEFLHVLRIREWMDLHRQLRRVAKEMDIRTTNVEAHPDHVHRALLAGLLSQIGHRSTDRSTRGATFQGARQAEFVIAPGSVLTRRPPEWVMAAELVDTGRIYARRVATIDPGWAEHLGSHLVSRSYGEPRWDEKHGRAVVTEQVTLFGLTLVSDRVLGLDRFDVDAARRVFLRRALVDREVPDHWLDRHPTVTANADLRARLSSLSDRVRTHDLLDDDDLFDFYDERIPDDVTSIDRFDRWTRETGAGERLALDDDIATELLGRRGIDLAGFPDVWRIGGVEVPLTYRFAPGEPLDGVTAHVPLAALAGLSQTPFEWQVPGRRRELVDATIRGLSKERRRALIPIDDTIEAVVERMGLIEGPAIDRAVEERPFADALGEHLSVVSGVRVSAAEVAASAVPDDLRVHVVVARGTGEDTEVLAVGDDLDEIRRQLVDETRSAVAKAAPIEERRGIVEWDVGDLPRSVSAAGDGGDGVLAHPTLLDVGDSVSLRVVTSPRVQERAMRGGVRRLLLLGAAPTRASIERLLTDAGRLAIAGADLELGGLADDCIVGAVDSLIDEHGDLPYAEDDFRTLERLVRAKGANRAGTALGAAVPIVVRAGAIARRLAELRAPSARDVVADVNDHLGRLVRPGFVAASGLDRLDDLDRYVRAIEHRVDHLAGAVDRDRRRLDEIRPLEQSYRRLVEGRAPDEIGSDVAALRWDLEELRVQVFAQPIGARGDVSIKRIRRRLAAAG
ncbi:MAG: ATP-dependent RNA helicase HrpA, partial [Actinomycetota bacterium]